jgi:hypothetical protein
LLTDACEILFLFYLPQFLALEGNSTVFNFLDDAVLQAVLLEIRLFVRELNSSSFLILFHNFQVKFDFLIGVIKWQSHTDKSLLLARTGIQGISSTGKRTDQGLGLREVGV